MINSLSCLIFRGRLKKRGPQDKAYHPTKLQEINIRRPYPFLCGVLTSGYHQHNIDGSRSLFSMYPREVQTHIKKIIPQLQEQGQLQATKIKATTSRDMERPSSNSEHFISHPLTVDDLCNYHTCHSRKCIIPAPNGSMFEAKTIMHPQNIEGDKAYLSSMPNNACKQVSNFQEGKWSFPNIYGSYQPSNTSQFQQKNPVTCQSLSQGPGLQQAVAISMKFGKKPQNLLIAIASTLAISF